MKKPLTSEEQHRRMLETPMPRLVCTLAAPTVMSQLISVAYNTADTYFVSQINTSASAAVGVSLISTVRSTGRPVPGSRSFPQRPQTTWKQSRPSLWAKSS